MSKYRLLDDGEIIQEDDQAYIYSEEKWLDVSCGDIGAAYSEALFVPMRRLIEGEPEPEQKTITVRIAVAVGLDTEDWNSYGKRFAGVQLPDSEKIDAAIHPLEGRLQVYWVEAVIPITEPPVIVGTVTEGEN